MAAGCSSGDWLSVEEQWNLPRYYAMQDHWKAFGPPAYVAIGGYLGLAKGYSSGTAEDDGGYGNLEDLERMFSGSGGVIGGSG